MIQVQLDTCLCEREQESIKSFKYSKTEILEIKPETPYARQDIKGTKIGELYALIIVEKMIRP